MRALHSVLFCCVAGLSFHAMASVKVDMKPGLWQNDMKMLGNAAAQLQSMQQEQMKTAMEEMKKQFANMPPEQRKQMEEYMAQSGMKFDGDSMSFDNGNMQVTPTSTSTKSCVTAEEIARGELTDNEEDECSSTLKQLSKTRIQSTQVCGGDSPSTMEMEVEFSSPKHYAGKGQMSQTISGKPYVFEVAIEGTWLATDCGDVKPDQEQ